MKSFFTPAVFVLIFAVFSSPLSSSAETRYVDDQLYITLRQGESSEHKIIKTLRTGTPLEVIEDGSPYMKVRTESGQEGYVLSRYISKEIPKNNVISNLEIERDRLSGQVADLQGRLNETASELESIKRRNIEIVQEAKERQAEVERKYADTAKALHDTVSKYEELLDQSKNVVENSDRLKKINKVNLELNREVLQLRKKDSSMKRSHYIGWFLAGGATLLLGWILGRIPTRRRRRY